MPSQPEIHGTFNMINVTDYRPIYRHESIYVFLYFGAYEGYARKQWFIGNDTCEDCRYTAAEYSGNSDLCPPTVDKYGNDTSRIEWIKRPGFSNKITEINGELVQNSVRKKIT